jgi:hypothetical protein
MNVLQTAVAVGWRHDADQPLQPVGPGIGQIARHEVAGEHRALEPVTQDDVRRIGDLVGIDADRAGHDANLPLVQSLGIPGLADAAEDVAQQGRGEAGEGPAAAYLHFEKQRLAFVHRHAARHADRLEAPLGGQPALVERVAGLVQRAHQGFREICLIVARRQPHILGGAAAERVGALVEPAMRKIEADPLHQGQRGATLQRDRERPWRFRRRRMRRLPGEHGIEQPREESGNRVEQAIDRGGRQPRLVMVEQRLVRAGAEGFGLGGGGFTGQREHALQTGQGHRKIVGWAGDAPHGFGF